MFEILKNEEVNEFVDKRLVRRYEKIEKMLLEGQSSILNKVSISRADRKGGYDFFRNPRVEEKHIKSRIYENMDKGFIKGKDLLVIQDTTEYDYGQTGLRLKDRVGLGDVGNKYGEGYFAH